MWSFFYRDAGRCGYISSSCALQRAKTEKNRKSKSYSCSYQAKKTQGWCNRHQWRLCVRPHVCTASVSVSFDAWILDLSSRAACSRLRNWARRKTNGNSRGAAVPWPSSTRWCAPLSRCIITLFTISLAARRQLQRQLFLRLSLSVEVGVKVKVKRLSLHFMNKAPPPLPSETPLTSSKIKCCHHGSGA